MIISLLYYIKIICNDVNAEKSLIESPTKNSYATQKNNVYEKKAIVKRSNSDEQVSNERYDEIINFKNMFGESEQEKTKALAHKLADEALKMPQFQRTMKKLTTLNESQYNNHNVIRHLPVDRMKIMSKSMIHSKKSNKLNHKGRKKKKRSKKGFKRIGNKHRLRRRNERPLYKRNHSKVGKIYSCISLMYNSKIFKIISKILRY
jgi:hypothetical protein